jgi:predicted Fe-S protein YdhL (DUF1289 family)
MSEAPVPSPCNKICSMDAEDRYCIGCRRTLDEIAEWGAMTNDERRAVLAELEARGREGDAGTR